MSDLTFDIPSSDLTIDLDEPDLSLEISSGVLMTATRQDYTVTNASVTRTLDVSTADLATLRAIVGTMIADLQDMRIFD